MAAGVGAGATPMATAQNEWERNEMSSKDLGLLAGARMAGPTAVNAQTTELASQKIEETGK
jgi:hypothetical protein